MRVTFKILIAFFLAASFIVLSYILILQKFPINSSSHFFKNRVNQVFFDSTTGCLDICLLRSYTRIDTNAADLIVYPYDYGYAKDSDNVYYKNGEVLVADPTSFEAVNRDLAKDKDGYFLYTDRLHDYINTEIDEHYVFNPQSIEVIAYSPFDTIIIKIENTYYSVHLNPQPKSIEILSGKSLEKYIR